MRIHKAFALAAFLLTAACSESTGVDRTPLDQTVATYELQKIDGLAWGTHPFKSYSGTRLLDRGAWTETFTYSADDVTRTLKDHGSYTVEGQTVVFTSRTTHNEHVGEIKGDRMVITPGTHKYHWQRVR